MDFADALLHLKTGDAITRAELATRVNGARACVVLDGASLWLCDAAGSPVGPWAIGHGDVLADDWAVYTPA